MTLEKASVLEPNARVRPHTAIAAGRVYQSTPGRPYTPFGRRMRHPRSAGAGPKSLLQMGRRGSLGATPAQRRLSVKVAMPKLHVPMPKLHVPMPKLHVQNSGPSL
jgi:hypothetical protein